MKVIITGATFGNKGAQSMLFTTIAMLRQNYPDVKIFFAHGGLPYLKDKFLFDEIFYTNTTFKVDFESSKIVAPKSTSWGSPKEILRTIGDSDLILDISDYSLGSKWGMNNSRACLNKMRFARALNVPIILMPQSFGPFDFDKHQKEMDKNIKDVMTYPEYIFVRELDGFRSLRKEYKLKNIFFHPDLVLASPPTDPAYIYKNVPKISVPKVLDASCVAVVPNMRSFDRSETNPWRTLQAYYEIINFLRKEGKIVYLLRHSKEDLDVCRWLKSLFTEDYRVVLWEDNFSCFGYDAVCRQFDFMIVGRYHGIVHAYKNNIPCILMGWAVKYKELAQLMYQSQYFFDLAAPEFDTREIFSVIRDIENNLDLNKKILRERLAQVQANSSCFVAVKKVLDKVAGRHSA